MKTKCFIMCLLALLICLTGCTAHVGLTTKVPEDVMAVQFETCSFLVPASLEAEATDFTPMLNMHYDTVEDRDVAKTTLSSGTIKGKTDTGYLLTSPNYFFYVSKYSGTIDLLTCSRRDVVSIVNRKDISFENYGRYIANADSQPKANMRVDFRVTTGNGTSRAYAGYLGLAINNNECYYYVAGYTYSTITEAQLKNCFDLVRSLR